jgi:hypothetical protein
MKRVRWPLSAAIFLLLLLVSFPAAASYDTAIRTAREFMWKSVTSGGINSCSAAILDGGEIVYSEGFGAADRAAGLQADGKTRFNIGSTSKMFAAAAILILADENRLGLDDPVIRHLPEFTMKDPRYRALPYGCFSIIHRDYPVQLSFSYTGTTRILTLFCLIPSGRAPSNTTPAQWESTATTGSPWLK